MNRDKLEVQEVLVDVPKYDKDGNPIHFDSLSSGGARNDNGALRAQYRNPRPPTSANGPEVDREFDERLSREYEARPRWEEEARRRREEEAEERRRKEYARAQFVFDNVVKPYVIPFAKKVWDTKVLPGGKRLAQRWLRPKRRRPEVPHENGDTPKFPAETANPLATSQHNTDVSTAQEGSADTLLADVIQIDEFQNRRSA